MITNQKDKICGLVGKTLGHSYSPQIHKMLADYDYSLFELREDELEGFIKSDKYHAVNVTIPYKRAVIPYLDEMSDIAKRIGAVNVVMHLPDGRLFGDNTDFYGFIYMMNRAKIDVAGKKVLVLGTGGTSQTVSVALEHMGAESIRFVSRTGEINYENAHEVCPDTQIIVNTTPVGMYPNNGVSPIDISKFSALTGVADVIFNPDKTQLLLDAEKLKIPHANGLTMLIAQAKRASEIFMGEEIDDINIEIIKKFVRIGTSNIVLIGMPGCGKTTAGIAIAARTGRTFIDTDNMVVELAGKSIPEIFAEDGEEAFRQLESQAIREAGKMSYAVIATGGGAVTREENYAPLHQNGKICFIKRDISQLSRDGRPLSLSGNLEDMYKKRLPMYQAFADFEVTNVFPDETSRQIYAMYKDSYRKDYENEISDH